MKACSTSLACEAPVLFTVLVTRSAGLGSRGCTTPVGASAPGPPSIAPHTCLIEAALRLDLGGSAHRWAVVRRCCLINTPVKPCEDRSPGEVTHTCPWPWSCRTACGNQPWVVSSCILNVNTGRHCVLGSTLCWQANFQILPRCWRKGTLKHRSEVLLCRVGLLCPTLWSWGGLSKTGCSHSHPSSARFSWQQYVCSV